MKTFSDIPSFIAHLTIAAAAAVEEDREGLEKAAKLIEDDAKASLGEYQAAVGPFPAWQELADSTQTERAKAGYSANDPLARSKTLEGAITHEVGHREAMIGVPITGELEPEGALVSDVAVDMEMGTSRAPPRPFMGPAAYRKGKEAAKIIGADFVSKLVGDNVSPDEMKVSGGHS